MKQPFRKRILLPAKITIGIPAFNEEANIEKILQSIFEQKEDGFKIGKVLLISDGSSDNTVYYAQKIGDSRLEIVDHKDRAGKSARMDEIFRSVKDDILVLFDADIILDSPNTLSALVKPIVNGNATLTSGHPIKVNTGTFTDNVMNVSQYLQDQVKLQWKQGRSVYACHGRAVAMHKKLFNKLQPPYSTVGNDAYIFFFNNKYAGDFEYANKATVLFKMPQSLKDFIKQQRRFSTSPIEQTKTFGEDTLSEYQIPKLLKLRIMLKAIFRYHIYAISYIFYQLIAKFYAPKSKAAWEISGTTKSI